MVGSFSHAVYIEKPVFAEIGAVEQAADGYSAQSVAASVAEIGGIRRLAYAQTVQNDNENAFHSAVSNAIFIISVKLFSRSAAEEFSSG